MARPDITVEVALKDTGLKKGFEAIAEVVDKFTTNANTLIKTQKKLENQQKKLKKTQQDLAKQQKQNNAELKKQNKIQKEAKKVTKDAEKTNKEFLKTGKFLENQAKKRVAKTEKLTKAEKKYIKSITFSAQQLKQYINEQNKSIKQNALTAKELKKVIIKRNEDAIAARKQRKAQRELSQTQIFTRKELKQMAKAATEAGTNFKKLGITLRTTKLALKGNQKAIGQVRKGFQLANITIKKTEKGFFNITNGGRLLSNSFATIRSKLLLVSFGMTLVTSVLVRQVKAFAKQEASVLKMARVFGTDGAKSLDEYSSELQKVTRFGDENINMLMAQFGSFGANVEQTKKLTEATLDFAEGMGIDLNNAGILIAKTFASSTNALSRYDIELDTSLDKQGKMVAIVDEVSEKFGGLAQLMGQTTTGQLDRATNSIGDLQERMGEALVPVVLMVANALKTMADFMPLSALRMFTNLIITSGVSLATYRATMVTVNAITKLTTVSTLSLGSAIKTLSILASKNWVGLLIAGATTAAASFLTWKQSTGDLTNAQKELAEKLNKIAEQNKLDIELDKEKIESIESSEKALRKKLDAMKAEDEITSPSALAKKLAFIEADRELSVNEQVLINLIYQRKKAREDAEEAEQKELDLKNQLIQAQQATANGEIAQLQATVDAAQLKNNLSLEEQAGLDILILKLKQLKKQRELDSNAIYAQADAINTTAQGFANLGQALGMGQKNVMAIQAIGAAANAYKAASDVMADETIRPTALRVAAAASMYASAIAQVAGIKQQQSKLDSASGGGIYGKFEQGGYVGGNRHSQGGTMIEAERGEFVMSRNAVESIGLETLNQMNQSGGGGNINVNVSGNVLTQDFVEGELAESIKEAVRRGSDFGIG